jgi:hypothetical protein
MRIAIAEMSNEALLRSLIDALPAFLFVVDEDVSILDYNASASALVGNTRTTVLRHRGGDVLHCIHSADSPDGCGRGVFCKSCFVRTSVAQALAGSRVVRRRVRMELASGETTRQADFLLTASPFVYLGYHRVLLVFEDLSDCIELQSILPVCTRCKRLRTDDAYLLKLEDYLTRHPEVAYSPQLCDECRQKEVQDVATQIPQTLPELSPSRRSARRTAR